MKYLYLIWRNLMRKKIRAVLTLASIFVAFVLYGALVAIKTGFTGGVELAGLDRMVTIHKVSLIMQLPQSYKNKILATDGVADVTHGNWFGGVYQEPKNFFAQVAVDAESYLRIYPEIRFPEEQKQAWLRNRMGAIVGRSTANRFGWKVGDRIPIRGVIWRTRDGSPWEFVLEGIYDGDKGFDNTNFFFHHKYLEEVTGIEGVIGWYVLRIEDPAHSVEIAERVDKLFANSQAETKTSTEKAFIQAFANQAGNIVAITIGVVSVVFFTLLLVAGNTMAQSVRERINELGVLKTLGFTDRQVMGLVLGESYLITVLGGVTGLGLVFWVTSTFDLGGSLLPTVYLPWSGVVAGGVLLVAMGFVAGAVPAFQALRLNIVDAMRRT